MKLEGSDYEQISNLLDKTLAAYQYRVNPIERRGSAGKVNKKQRQIRIVPKLSDPQQQTMKKNGTLDGWIQDKLSNIKKTFPGKLLKLSYKGTQFTDAKFNLTTPNSGSFSSVSFLIDDVEFDIVITTGRSARASESTQILKTLNDLNALKGSKQSAIIMIGSLEYEIDGIVQIPGVPKADAALTFKNVKKVFLSLKKGGGPGNFQQYGGWAVDQGLSSRSDIARVPEVDQFINRIDNIFAALGLSKDQQGRYDFGQFKKGSNFATYLKDKQLTNKAKYGKDYGTTNWGINNCQMLIDGNIIFKQVGNGLYTIDGQYHSEINPIITGKDKPNDPNDLYSPVLFMAKAEGVDQAGYAHARATIWPNNRVAKSYIALLEDVESKIKAGKIDEVRRRLI